MNFWIMLIVLFSKAGIWIQTDWSGGPYQAVWSDPSKFFIGENVDISEPGVLKLKYTDWRNWWMWPPGEDSICNEVYVMRKTSDGNIWIIGRYRNTTRLYRSTNSGKDWQEISEIDIQGIVCDMFEISPGIFCIGVSVAGEPPYYTPIYTSTDYGETWEEIEDLDLWRTQCIYSFARLGDFIFAGGSDGRVFVTQDGLNWEKFDSLPGVITALSGEGEQLYAGISTDICSIYVDMIDTQVISVDTTIDTVIDVDTLIDTAVAMNDTILCIDTLIMDLEVDSFIDISTSDADTIIEPDTIVCTIRITVIDTDMWVDTTAGSPDTIVFVDTFINEVKFKKKYLEN